MLVDVAIYQNSVRVVYSSWNAVCTSHVYKHIYIYIYIYSRIVIAWHILCGWSLQEWFDIYWKTCQLNHLLFESIDIQFWDKNRTAWCKKLCVCWWAHTSDTASTAAVYLSFNLWNHYLNIFTAVNLILSSPYACTPHYLTFNRIVTWIPTNANRHFIQQNWVFKNM